MAEFDAEAAVRELVKSQMASFRGGGTASTPTARHPSPLKDATPPATMDYSHNLSLSTVAPTPAKTSAFIPEAIPGWAATPADGQGLTIREQARQAAMAAFAKRGGSSFMFGKPPSPIRALSPSPSPVPPRPASPAASAGVTGGDYTSTADAILAQQDAELAAAVQMAVAEERAKIEREAERNATRRHAASQRQLAEVADAARTEAEVQTEAAAQRALAMLRAEQRGALAASEAEAAAMFSSERSRAAAELALAVKSAVDDTAAQGAATRQSEFEAQQMQHMNILATVKAEAATELATARRAAAIDTERAALVARQEVARTAASSASLQEQAWEEKLACFKQEHEEALVQQQAQAASDLIAAKREAQAQLQKSVGDAIKETAQACDVQTTREIEKLVGE